jgi:hypothetical protein
VEKACGKGVWKKHGKAPSLALIGILQTPSTTEKGRKKRTSLQQKTITRHLPIKCRKDELESWRQGMGDRHAKHESLFAISL